jgi:hypothetical protein
MVWALIFDWAYYSFVSTKAKKVMQTEGGWPYQSLGYSHAKNVMLMGSPYQNLGSSDAKKVMQMQRPYQIRPFFFGSM